MRTKIITIFFLTVFTVLSSYAQSSTVTLSGLIQNKTNKAPLSFVNIILKKEKDSAFVTGTVSNEEGRFTMPNIASGNYILQYSYIGFTVKSAPIFLGSLTSYLNLGVIELVPDAK